MVRNIEDTTLVFIVLAVVHLFDMPTTWTAIVFFCSAWFVGSIVWDATIGRFLKKEPAP